MFEGEMKKLLNVFIEGSAEEAASQYILPNPILIDGLSLLDFISE